MKTKFIYLSFLLGYLLALVSCASKEKRTISSDQCLRAAINRTQIDIGTYQAVLSALLKTKKFILVDRGPGMAMINEERQAQWGTSRAVFEPSMRAAIGGHIQGAGAVITPVFHCEKPYGFFGKDVCRSGLSIASARTGVILGGVSSDSKRPNWEKLVAEFIETYPEYFTEDKPTGTRLLEEGEQLDKSETAYTPGEYIP